MTDSIRALVDAVMLHDTVRSTDTLWVLQTTQPWRDALQYLGPLAVVAAAALAAFFTYWYNKRLFRQRVMYDAYKRLLPRMDALSRVVDCIGSLAAEAISYLPPCCSLEEVGDSDITHSQRIQKGWRSILAQMEKAYTELWEARDALRHEYEAHIPVLPASHAAVSAICDRLLTLDAHMRELEMNLRTAAESNEGFPFGSMRSVLRTSADQTGIETNRLAVWLDELLGLFRLQTYGGWHRGGPDVRQEPNSSWVELRLTPEGFQPRKRERPAEGSGSESTKGGPSPD